MRFLTWLFILLLLPLLLATLMLALAIDQTPLVKRAETLSPVAVAEAKRLLASNDPRRLQRGDQRTAAIPAALIDEAVNYLASRLLGRGSFTLAEETAEVRLTATLPVIPGPRFVNLRLVFREGQGEARIVAASIGSLPIPSLLAEVLSTAAIRAVGFAPDWQLAQQAIRRLDFEPDRGIVRVSYTWDPGLVDRAVSLAFTAHEVARIKAAQHALVSLLEQHSPRARVSLVTVLGPLLVRPGEGTGEQRRAALFVLASYLSEKNLAIVLPEARQWPRPRPVKLTLLGRHDSAQHFAISAALAAWAGEPAANAIGLYKEIEDSQAGGSGFSFADLAADRAGTRFGELVVADSPRLHEALRGPLREGDLLPSLAGLPENLPEAEFARRYGARDNAAYRQMASEIEGRLAALSLYR